MKKSPLTTYGLPLTNIIIQETAGISRSDEPVTVGVPFPKGLLKDPSQLSLIDPVEGKIPLQAQPVALWPDNTAKWVLLDFQITTEARTTKELKLSLDDSKTGSDVRPLIFIQRDQDCIQVNTKAASFFLNTDVFKPFDRVVTGGKEIQDGTKSRIVLTDESGTEYEPIINKILHETEGPIRATIKIEGVFKSSSDSILASFFSRIHFFMNRSMIKMEFTILNPRAAKHQGGLWDLGDPGSILFKDLSVHSALNINSEPSTLTYQLTEDPIPMAYQQVPNDQEAPLTAHCSHLTIYQDSSGGENWRSRNHVNRNNEVKNSFRGYRIYEDGKLRKEGFRANPIISISQKRKKIAATVQYFWQNFPKALEAENNTLIIRLFPMQYDDVFELQGGEQKTHTLFFDFGETRNERSGLEWTTSPLIPHALPAWYAQSGAFYYLIPESKEPHKELAQLISPAVTGDNTFFHRRELVDEYGWRNFGEFYADHEAVGHNGDDPLISHYNNQYDCIYGSLLRFVGTGDLRWYILADQLCKHVVDIDIYHTDDDRAEYNRGLFWLTEHYLDVQTATHRCFSKRHAEYRNMAAYGGGPALSHNYTTGLQLYYYMTGAYISREAFEELVSFVECNMDQEGTVSNQIIIGLRNSRRRMNDILRKKPLVQYGKVYGLEGPGRASGNALNTLIDAYTLTKRNIYLKRSENLICYCIHPEDDIEKRDLLDIENRWMYTVFLQALGKYLDVKTEEGHYNDMWQYARQCLIRYAKWMLKNEHLYLEKPEKLEYPNETWPAQDIRKCNVLLYATKYSDSNESQTFQEKATFFYTRALRQLLEFETRFLARPIVLMMLNGMMYQYFLANGLEPINFCRFNEKSVTTSKKNFVSSFSLKKEIQFIKSRLSLNE